VFEFRVGRSRQEVAALFGDGLRLVNKGYVEDPDTGSRLIHAGGIGRDVNGGAYVLRWHGRAIGLEYEVERRDDEHGAHPLFTLSHLGTSRFAVINADVAHVDLTPEDAARAMQVAAEASVVLESHREDHGPGSRVRDPLDAGRELSPADFGYGEITRAPWGAR
jgi:hypothetical protein